MGQADAFWSSRARVVYILEEELNGFLTDYFTCYFVVKILHFRGPWFCLSKTEVCGAWSLLKRAPRELQESCKGAPGEPLGASWGTLGLSWGSWGAPGGRLGSLGPFSKPKRAQHSSRRAQYNPRHWISKNLQKPMFFYGFCILRLPQDRPAPPPETSRELQESLGEASGSLIRV